MKPQNPFDIAREIARDSIPLTAVEQSAFDLCRQRASQAQCITQLDISLAIGSHNSTGSTASGVLNRLEAKGHITRTFYQRGVQVCIVETGECTLAPPCTSAHWRKRPQGIQTPPIAAVRQRNPPLSEIIESEARKGNVPIHEFLMDLVYNGLELYLDSKAETA